MDFRQLARYVPALWESGSTVYLEGPPGCGKSEFTRQVPDIMSARLGTKVGFHKIDASVLDPAEVPGFIAPVKSASGEAIAAYLRSALMPTEEYLKEHPVGLYFVDELAATVPAVRHALDGVLLEHRFGPRYLPEGWRVWAAGNRTVDFSGAQHLEAKTQNRVCRIQVEVNVDQWVEDYAMPRRLDSVCTAFLKTNPKVLADKVPAERQPFCTLRSFTHATRFWMSLKPHERTDAAFPVVAGFIGDGPAAEFLAYYKYSAELPTIEEILANPERAKVPKKLDVMYAAQLACVQAGFDGKDLDTLWRYIQRLAAELHLPAARQWARREATRRRLGTSKALAAYVARHAPDLIEIMEG